MRKMGSHFLTPIPARLALDQFEQGSHVTEGFEVFKGMAAYAGPSVVQNVG